VNSLAAIAKLLVIDLNYPRRGWKEQSWRRRKLFKVSWYSGGMWRSCEDGSDPTLDGAVSASTWSCADGGADGMPRADWVVRRTDADWRTRSGPSLEWLEWLEWMESFVEQERFLGTCYRVANWRFVGSTQGRRRQDREHRLKVPVKDVYLHSQSCASLCARRFYF
jgi:hypothetical protein